MYFPKNKVGRRGSVVKFIYAMNASQKQLENINNLIGKLNDFVKGNWL